MNRTHRCLRGRRSPASSIAAHDASHAPSPSTVDTARAWRSAHARATARTFGTALALGACATALGLGACATAPVPTLLTLQASGERTVKAPAAARAPLAVEILPVGLPTRVDRTELVVTTADGDVRVIDNLRWVASPGDELREGLAQRLDADHGIADATGLRVAGAEVIRLRLMVRRFDTRLDDGSFALDTDWQLTRPGDAPAGPTCRFSMRVAAPSSRLDGSAHRLAVDRLTAQLATFARDWSAKPDTPCP